MHEYLFGFFFVIDTWYRIEGKKFDLVKLGDGNGL